MFFVKHFQFLLPPLQSLFKFVYSLLVLIEIQCDQMATFFAHHLSIYIWPKIKTIAKVRLNFLENNKETDKFCPKVDKVGKILAISSHTVVNSPYFITNFPLLLWTQKEALKL